MGSCLMLTSASWADSTDHRTLMAQQVTDGLPPPPTVFGQETVPTTSPDSATPPADLPRLGPTAPGQQYMVIVNGDSPLLLSQVQAVMPSASLQDYNGQRFIQAGLFDNPSLAQQQVSALAAQGIGAEIVTINATTASSTNFAATPTVQSDAQSAPVQPSSQTTLPVPPPDLLPASPVPREVEFGQPPATNQLTEPLPSEVPEAGDRDRAFYVVVPGRSENLEAMTNQIARLGEGVGLAGMVHTDNSRGSHVRIGPFVDRGAANRWRKYLRDFGMDARVYYRR
jgi:hypothetical protein